MRIGSLLAEKFGIMLVISIFIISTFTISSAMAASVTIQAKAMKLSGTYKLNSNGTRIKLKGASGQATTSFSGSNGNYKVAVQALGLSSGQSKLDLYIGSQLIQSFIYPKRNGQITLKTKSFSIKKGDQVRLDGFRYKNGDARLKALVFTSVGASTSPSAASTSAAPAPKPKPAPAPVVASTPAPAPAPAPARAPASTGGFSVSNDAELVSVVDFESSNTIDQLLKRGKKCEYDCIAVHNGLETYKEGVKIVSDITRNGNRAIKLSIDSRIPYPNNKPRADLAMVGDFRAVYPGEDMWMGYSIYYPETHTFGSNFSNDTWGPGLHEIQAEGDAYGKDCTGGGGPITFNELEDTFRFRTKWSGTLADCLNKKYKYTNYTNLAKIKRGAWNDLIFHYRLCADLSHGCTPHVEVWINGNQVVNSTALVGDAAIEHKVWYKFDVAYYAHHETKGIYKRPLGIYSIYVDDIRIARGKNAKDLVDPAKVK